jgi:hypothetical protein
LTEAHVLSAQHIQKVLQVKDTLLGDEGAMVPTFGPKRIPPADSGTAQHRLLREFVRKLNTSEFIKARMKQEFDGLVVAIENVEQLTDPHDLEAAEGGDDPRTNAISFKKLVHKIVRHTSQELIQSSEVATQELAVKVFDLLRRLVERRLDNVGEDVLDEPLNLLEPLLEESCILKPVPLSLGGDTEATWVPVRTTRNVLLGYMDSVKCLLLMFGLVVTSFVVLSSASIKAKMGEGGMQNLNDMFAGLFLLEVVLRLWCMGPCSYLSSIINVSVCVCLE